MQVYESFIDILHDFNLTQMVTQPTRYNNILDLFLTTNNTLVEKVSSLPGLADHDIVSVSINLKAKMTRPKPRYVQLFKKANWDGIKEGMRAYREQFLSTSEGKSVESLWVDFTTSLNKLVDTYIPRKLVSGKYSLPWMTQAIKRKIRKRDKLYRHHRKTGNQQSRKLFLQTRHIVKAMIKVAYGDYVEGLLGLGPIDQDNPGSSSPVNTKKLFSFLKSSKQDQHGISPLQKDGKLCSDTREKADILNDQFRSVFTPKSPLLLSQLSQMKVQELAEKSLLDPTKSPLSPSACPIMPDLHISTKGIQTLLKNLKTEKASGPDKLQPLLLKELKDEISPILQVIFTRSLETGVMPTEWAIANVAPLFKKGEKSLAENYRPISLTCILCKVMEHIVTSNLCRHLNSNNILYDLQHGFREKRSCETQLAMLIEDLTRNASIGKQTDLVLLDFSKAFDKVNHEKLLYKLHCYGVRENTLNWIRAFLNGRSQKVVIEGEESGSVPVTSGVPQGSVLGPILFVIYINDLPDHIISQVRLFADDTAVYITIRHEDDGKTLQHDLDTLQVWEKNWDMHFNPSKCQILHISRTKSPVTSSYTLHGQVLEAVASAKYLGATISNNLSWNQHITNITNKANSTLGFVKRNIKTTNPKVREQTYKTLVRPQIEYASVIWDPYTQQNINKIEMVQRRAARWTVNDYSRQSSVTDMLSSLGWCSLQDRRTQARLCLFYKIVNSLVAIPLPQHIQPSNRISRYCHSMTFRQIHTNTDFYKYSFFPRTVVQWNSLSESTVTQPDLEHFKTSLGTARSSLP
ncbi:MAG: reverse transcriptase family protein [Sedimenticola sp.]